MRARPRRRRYQIAYAPREDADFEAASFQELIADARVVADPMPESDERACPSCGHGNRSRARFCEACGQALQSSCDACGNELRPGARFCDACGAPVAAAAPEASQGVRPSVV